MICYITFSSYRNILNVNKNYNQSAILETIIKGTEKRFLISSPIIRVDEMNSTYLKFSKLFT